MAPSDLNKIRSRQFTDRQLEVLRVLWERGEGSVNNVHGAVRSRRDVARVTIATVLVRLAKQGVLRTRRKGRELIYRPVHEEAYWTNSMTDEFAERVFRGDLPAAVARLIRASDIKPGDLDEVRALIDKAEQNLERDPGTRDKTRP